VLNWFGRKRIYKIWRQVKRNDVSLHCFRPTKFSHSPFDRKIIVSAENLGNRLFFTDSVRITYFGRKKLSFSRKILSAEKPTNGTVCRNLRIPSSLPELWRLQTPANTQNLVSKLIPTFAKLNLLSMDIICFHFHYFYLILFNFFFKKKNHCIIFSGDIMIQ
jgi:hypothetical protein